MPPTSATVMCQLKSVMGVMFLSMLEGMAIGWASPGHEKMTEGEAPYPVTTGDISWIISLFDIGVMLGSWTSTAVFSLAGRRQTVLVGPIALSCWVVLTFIGSSTPMLIVARILSGMGMGIALSFSFIYAGEVTSPTLRGPIIMAITLLMPFGQLLAFLIGSNVSWQWQSVYPAPFIVLMVVCVIFFMQESPVYLATKDRIEDMEKSLRALRVGIPEEAILDEIAAIQRSVKQRRERATGLRETFAHPGSIKAALIVVVECSALALLGVTNVLAYTQQIFIVGKGDILSATLSSVLVIIVEIGMITVAVFMIERLGRRLQLTMAACGTAISMFALSGYFAALEVGHKDVSSWNWVPLLTLLIFIGCVGGGINTVPQVLMSEFLDEPAKAIIAPIAMTIMALTSFGINYAFHPIGESAGYWVPFLFFGCTNTFIALFTLIVVPETKGKSLLEVQEMLRGGNRLKKERL